MAAKVNVSFKLGATWPIVLSCYDASGAPLADAGANVRVRVSQCGILFLDLAVGSGVTIASTNPLVANIVITPAMQVAAQMTGGSYQWESDAVLTGGAISDQTAGTFTVESTLF